MNAACPFFATGLPRRESSAAQRRMQTHRWNNRPRPPMTTALPAPPETLRTLLAQTLAGRADATAAVVCLCAAWCGTCRDFRPGFEQAARAHPQAVFRWLDIEDEADALGNVDVETFPTLVIGGADGTLRFAGPVPPQPGQIARLLQALGL